MRVSDSERERIVRELTQHCGDGRLTLDELEERIAEAYAATTNDELQLAIRELPATPRKLVAPPPRRADAPPVVSPAVRTTHSVSTRSSAGEIALKVHAYVFVSVMALLVAIWVLTMPGGYFWPVWPALGMGLPLAIHAGVEKARGSS